MSYVAHICQYDGRVQTLREHLLETRALAELFGQRMNIGYLAGLAGLLHDVGKYNEAFQEYIQAAVYEPEKAPPRGSVDHSTAGGQLLFELFHSSEAKVTWPGLVAELVSNAIFSHHSYLQDFLTPLDPLKESTFWRRVHKPLPELKQVKERFFLEVIPEKELRAYVDQAATELASFFQQKPSLPVEDQFMFLSKFVFSMLIDADRTGTQLFAEQLTQDPLCDFRALWHTYANRLQQRLDQFPDDTPINQLRSNLSEQCLHFAEHPPGIYELSIPTGGGKTLASLRYALAHAQRYAKRRILYVLPYTTIIEQNTAVVREVLQDDHRILEHHSQVIQDVPNEKESEEGLIHAQQKLRLARDHWDVPIIFTTMVQFLNSFYAGGTRSIRRLHQLSDAVIIFDEVQKVPPACVALFNQAVRFLQGRAGASVVLCTATQPALDFVEERFALKSDGEMIANLSMVTKALQRIHIVDRATRETWNTEKLADFVTAKVSEVETVLVVLNTRSVVRRLYDELCERRIETPLYHLSTRMCAAHRQHVLQTVQARLDAKQPVICISTDLIEAGVNISFACVIRSLAGLDSIAQAAGRCNRHGEHERQNVYVIDHAEENLKNLEEIARGKRVTRGMMIDLQRGEAAFDDLLSASAIQRYFQEYYQDQNQALQYPIASLKRNMTELLMSRREENQDCQAYQHETHQMFPLAFPHSYGTAAKYFRVIRDEQRVSVIVPYGEGAEIIAELNGDHSSEKWGRILRRAQPYLIELFEYEKEQLMQAGGIVSYAEGHLLALKERAYDEKYGLDLQMDAEMEPPII